MCHYGHLLDFGVALLCFGWLWPLTFPDAGTWQVDWVAKVVAFNLAVEFTIYGALLSLHGAAALGARGIV